MKLQHFLQQLPLFILWFAVLGPAAMEISAFTTSPVVAGYASSLATATTNNNSQEPMIRSVHVLNAAPNMDDDNEDSSDMDIKKKGKLLVPSVALVTLLSCAVAAKVGILPGEPLVGGGYGVYTDSMIGRDVGSAVLTGTLGYIFVKLNTWLAANGYLEPRDSRKIVHTLSAPLFIVFWPLFSAAQGARFFAASVSFVNAIRLFIAGSGGDKSLAFALSRSGDQKEALGGPFLYVIILCFSIVLFWKDGPIGIVALSAMAAGDGLADLVGRRYGKNNKWSFNPDKSIAGSLAFWVGATACALVLLKVLVIDLQPNVPFSAELVLTGIMATTAMLEVAPVKIDDNYLVPLSAAVLTAFAFV